MPLTRTILRQTPATTQNIELHRNSSPDQTVRLRSRTQPRLRVLALLLAALPLGATAKAGELRAGAAKVDITKIEAGPVSDRLYAKALAITDGTTTAVIVTVDAVAIGEIGYIRNDYLGKVRGELERDLKIPPTSLIVNASHCHGIVCDDVAERTVKAVKEAWQGMVPVKVGAGIGQESRIMENRRLKLKNGREADVRHAYSLPPDEEVAAIGPTDPEIGVLRFDRLDGHTLAVVYNFACHPIQGVPSGGNTADMTGFASQVIEDTLGPGAIALFVQGCAGDINPVQYKDVANPRDAQTLGNLLGLSTMKAAKAIKPRDEKRFKLVHEVMELPRADLTSRILALQAEQTRLLQSLKGTSLNLKTFIPLVVKYNSDQEFPSYYSHRYLHDKMIGRDDLSRLDLENRRNMQQYIQNIYTMEELTRVQTNLALLHKHQMQNVEAGKRTVDVELVGLRIGDFVMTTFPGELTVQTGLDLKKSSPHDLTFVAGYTNGYIYYAPTEEQARNSGHAQEDCDCILSPEWHALYMAKAAQILKGL